MGRGNGARDYKSYKDYKPWPKADSGASWRVWPGAYSPTPAPWKRGPQPSQDLFPTYSEVAPGVVEQLNQQGIQHSAETGNLVTDMQTALNSARKAETRVIKLHKAYEKAQEQWAAYEQMAKINFQRERRRFANDLEKIEKDALDAEDQQEHTRAIVRQIALREAAAAGKGLPVRSNNPTDPQVAALFSSWAEEDGAALTGVFQRAFQGQTDVPTTPVRVHAAPPRTPAPSRSAVPESPKTEAVRDPYMTTTPVPAPPAVSASPTPEPTAASAPPPGLSPGQVPKHPGQRDMEATRVRTSEAPPRANIKAATKGTAGASTSHVTLRDKLQEKRAALRAFGVATVPAVERAHAMPGSGPPDPGPQTAIIDDDPDVDAFGMDDWASLGLFRLLQLVRASD